MTASVERLRKLVEYVDGPEEAKRFRFDWGLDRRDGAEITFDKKGIATVQSWMESHHNGDHYDSKSEKLSREASDKALGSVYKRLEDRAIDRLLDEERKAEAKAIRDRARARLEEKLTGPKTAWEVLEEAE